jgi:RNA polymerase sigma-70 factor, ECF subfamily
MTAPSSSFQAFYAAAWSRLVGQVYPITGDLAAAEDAVQEAMVRAADHWDRIRRYEQPEAWVRLVAMRLASNGLRRVRRQAAMLARLGPPVTVQPFEPEDRALVEALAELPRRFREVLVLHHLADLSVDQVARHLGLPSGTVKGRLVEGRRRLALLLGGDEQRPAADESPREEPNDARATP